eukprot:jgi/Hompol1/818/HPOL_002431-RA
MSVQAAAAATSLQLAPTDDKVDRVMIDLHCTTQKHIDDHLRFKVSCQALINAFMDRLVRLTKRGDVVFTLDNVNDPRWTTEAFRLDEMELKMREEFEEEAIKFRRACTEIGSVDVNHD